MNKLPYIALGAFILTLIAKKMNAATNFIAQWEGLKLSAYKDSGGVWTIGYGSTRNYDFNRPVKQGDFITRQKAIEWLAKDTESAAATVKKLVKVALTNNQRVALSSFVYNVGPTAFSKSTLLKKLNVGRPKTEVANEFTKWIYVNGVPVAGLINRRNAEKNLFLS